MQKWSNFTRLKLGDWLILVASLVVVGYLFLQLTSNQPAQKMQIRLANKAVGTYSLNQQRRITLIGPMGTSIIEIHYGKARFLHAPCHNQYCIQQGWLTRAGQMAVCLPNQLSLQLLGRHHFDSLSY